jgi:predicted Rossmann fold flavoprotein
VQVVVVGAGAAGMMAAIWAARAGANVALLETREKPGAKIRVSGGGRCNVLPSVVDLDDFHTSGSQKSMRNVLFSWPLSDVTSFFADELGIPLKIEPNGKVFPKSDRAKDVLEALLRECERAGVTMRAPFRVVAVRGAESGRFELESDEGEMIDAAKVILATGGLSLPKTGSDGAGFDMARALGHGLEPTYPALVPLLTEEPGWRELAGISLVARIRATRQGATIEEREGDLLFTHRGFSGPVVLDMSRHISQPDRDGVRLTIRWGGEAAPDWDERLLDGGKSIVGSILREVFPRRLSELFVGRAGLPASVRLSDLTKVMRKALVRELEECPVEFSGDEGYRTAEVTAGGIPLGELKTKTLESRQISGLHFAGEIVDVVGRIGGYNFLWAWASGRRAGEGAARSLG